jgi:hypothetical protein
MSKQINKNLLNNNYTYIIGIGKQLPIIVSSIFQIFIFYTLIRRKDLILLGVILDKIIQCHTYFFSPVNKPMATKNHTQRLDNHRWLLSFDTSFGLDLKKITLKLERFISVKLNKQLYYTRGLNECLTCDVNALAASPLALLNALLDKHSFNPLV